ncbi:hypothetical protein OROMI_030986 [Orobanche minor]
MAALSSESAAMERLFTYALEAFVVEISSALTKSLVYFVLTLENIDLSGQIIRSNENWNETLGEGPTSGTPLQFYCNLNSRGRASFVTSAEVFPRDPSVLERMSTTQVHKEKKKSEPENEDGSEDEDEDEDEDAEGEEDEDDDSEEEDKENVGDDDEGDPEDAPEANGDAGSDDDDGDDDDEDDDGDDDDADEDEDEDEDDDEEEEIPQPPTKKRK